MIEGWSRDVLLRRGGFDFESYGVGIGVVQTEDLRDFLRERSYYVLVYCTSTTSQSLLSLLKPSSGGSNSTDMMDYYAGALFARHPSLSLSMTNSLSNCPGRLHKCWR